MLPYKQTDSSLCKFNILENKGDNRKQKKVQELVQHFVSNVTLCTKSKLNFFSIDESLREIMKKRKGKKKNCLVYTNLKQTSTNIFCLG